MNVTVYGNDICYVYYMLRNMKRYTLHRIVGLVSCNAYISQNGRKANYTARVEPESIEPLILREHDAVLQAELVLNTFAVSDKLAFITRLFILQNWEMSFVRAPVGDKVEFAFEMLRLQHSLVTNGLLPQEVEKRCLVENVEVTTTTPLRSTQVSNEQVVIMNNDFV